MSTFHEQATQVLCKVISPRRIPLVIAFFEHEAKQCHCELRQDLTLDIMEKMVKSIQELEKSNNKSYEVLEISTRYGVDGWDCSLSFPINEEKCTYQKSKGVISVHLCDCHRPGHWGHARVKGE